MKKYLFILISLSSLGLFANNIYVIKSGDTLFSISRDFGISYSSLLYNNPQVAMSPDNLKIGQELKLSYPRTPYEMVCFDEAPISEIYLDESIQDRLIKCLNLIESNEDLSFLDDEQDEVFWITFNSKTTYITYIKNKFFHEFHSNDKSTEEELNLIKFIKQAAMNGNWHAYQMWEKWGHPNYSFGEEPEYKGLEVYEDHKILFDLINADFNELGYQNFIEHCKNQINLKNATYNNLTAIYRACGSLSFILGDKTAYSIFEKAINHVLSNENNVIDLRELSHVTATFNYLSVADQRDNGLRYISNYLKKICSKCESTDDYLDLIMKLENDSSRYLQFRFWDKFFILLSASYLNDHMLKDLSYDEFKKRNDLLLEKYLSKYKDEGLETAQSDGILIDIYLDFAEGSIINNDCRRAYKFYDMALSIESKGQSKRVDIETSPFNLMHCYQGSRNNNNHSIYSPSEVEASLNLANRYWQEYMTTDDPNEIKIFDIDFSTGEKEDGTIFNQIHPAEVAYIVINNFYSSHVDYSLDKIEVLFQKVSELFIEIGNSYEISSVENHLRDIIIMYTDIYFRYANQFSNAKKK